MVQRSAAPAGRGAATAAAGLSGAAGDGDPAGCPSDVPHRMQNESPGLDGVPHAAQVTLLTTFRRPWRASPYAPGGFSNCFAAMLPATGTGKSSHE